jgi:hypothetical protein
MKIIFSWLFGRLSENKTRAGQSLWRIKDRPFVVQHQLHPDELEAFDTTRRLKGN